MPKALVLSSGGVDSTTCLGLAVHELGAANVVSVSMFYGQKHKKELEAAQKLAEYYNVQHYELDLSAVFAQSNCSLLSHSTQEVPEGDYADQIGRSVNGMVSTFVPFRNGMFLSAAASLAVSLFPDEEVYIYIGAHADDAAGNAYADCDNGNRSAIHWDLVLIQRPEYGGGEIYFDDKLIRKDGLFVLPELECLNPDNLK